MSLASTRPILTIRYEASPTMVRFHQSDAFFRGMMGPVGSGKSVGCCAELMDIARKQWPNVQNIRRTRMVIVRNTSPQLETTTIKTWTDWFPEHIFGKISGKAPYTQMIRFPLEDGTRVECEVIFLALDKPEDVKKLLSLECTVVWFNEAREIDKVMVDMATGRVGRFPSQKERPDDLPASEPWPTRACIIADTNPPNDDHWWHDYAEHDGWRKDPETGIMKPLESIPREHRWAFFRQPGGRSPEAENIKNLRPGYYQQQMMGKDSDYIRVMVDGEYGMIQAGKPVYKASYNRDLHVAPADIDIDSRRQVFVGIDASGRNPSAIFAQRSDEGQTRLLRELVCEDMGAQVFSALLRRFINEHFPGNPIKAWGDPAGTYKNNSDERTYFDIIRQHAQVNLLPSPVLRIAPRIEAVRSTMMRLTYGGRPALLVSPSCKVLIAGFGGGYIYKQLQVSNRKEYHDDPEKNRYSDIQDALQYLLCGMGEYRTMTRGDQSHAPQPQQPAVNLSGDGWNIF